MPFVFIFEVLIILKSQNQKEHSSYGKEFGLKAR